MSLSHRYRQLAALIDALESQGLTVRDAQPLSHTGEELPADGSFPVQLVLEMPADADCFGENDVTTLGSVWQSLHAPIGTNTTTAEATSKPADGEDVDGDGAGVEEEALANTDEPNAHTAEESDGAAQSEAVDNTEQREPATDDVENTTEATTGEETDTAEDTAEEGDVEPEGAATKGDDVVACTHPDCNRVFETERGMKIHRTKAHPLSELVGSTSDQTVHYDPDVLAEVYDEYETFAEMTDALGVDVGAQAVRKQMIRHGIHKPGTAGSTESSASDRSTSDRPLEAETKSSERTPEDGDFEPSADERNGSNGDADAPDESGHPDSDSTADSSERTDHSHVDEPEDESDDESDQIADRLPDLDLPGSISARDLQTAVETANTLYDVQRALGLDRETTRDVLAEYDLLELVSGRAASVREREELKAEINQRLRRTAT